MDSNTSKTPSPPKPIKKENEEEIKEFAETAMNELLGWYGYEGLELRRWAASRARGASPEQASEHKNKDECSWCNKSITDNGALQQAGAVFCSELCFSQSRRANFKRAKTCDWCRHVRHTVAYVDFQDGATQLQFCSDKCLNQYKMHIFCRETQAHLDLNPHLAGASSGSSLITPELWLRTCRSRSRSRGRSRGRSRSRSRSRSASPASERSGSPPENTKTPERSETKDNRNSRKSPLPLITIAPSAKLMKPKTPDERTPVQKSPETKKESRLKMNLRKRRASKCSATVTSQTVKHASAPKAQDLRMRSPSMKGSSPASTVGNSAIHSPPHPINPHNMPTPQFSNPMYGMPPPVFMDSNHMEHRPIFQPRFGFMPRPGMPMHQERPRIPPPLNFPPLGQGPPVTVLVPYPVLLPIPLPIPIPIPFASFLQAHNVSKVKTESNMDDAEGPLDFTMNSDKNKDEESKENKNEVNTESDKNSSVHSSELNDRIEEEKQTELESNEIGNAEQTLPKFKITRLGNKMAKIVTKTREPSESSRPLRKRRRLVEVPTEDDPLISKTRKIVQV